MLHGRYSLWFRFYSLSSAPSYLLDKTLKHLGAIYIYIYIEIIYIIYIYVYIIIYISIYIPIDIST